jgi:hypothetical protein
VPEADFVSYFISATTVLPLFLSPLLIVRPHQVLPPRGLDLRPGF